MHNSGSATGALEDQTLSRLKPEAARSERGDWSDLGARLASGIVLGVAGVTAAWFGGPWLAGACGAAVVAMSYEWARMSEPEAVMPAFLLALAGSLGAVMFASWGHLFYGAGWMAACMLVSGCRRRSVVAFVETVGGGLYVGLPCALFLWLRGREPDGLETILSLFAMIWSADVFAYFGGKVIGGPKIAEGLSPNKTWSGIVAGVLAGAAAGWACGAMVGAEGLRLQVWVGVGVLIAFTGLMGDLFESFLKRRFGVKDASKLIPGHGGVLDRIDGLMAATLLTGAVLAAWPDFSAWLIEGRS